MHYLEEKLFIRKSQISGTGVFTSVDINEGTHIIIISGEVISEDECVRREEEENNVFIFWNDLNYIDTVNTKKIKYLNHNCNPNCYVEERNYESLFLIAEKDIKAGEELTIDYDYEEIYEDCSCGECSKEVFA
jgi:uncharacterized protein